MKSNTKTARLLTVSNLTVSTPSGGGWRELIHAVSFDLREKEVLVVLGESGSGKTILSRSLTGLFPPTSALKISGSVSFEGRQLVNLAGRELASIRRRRIRYVFQEPMQSLNPLAKIGQQMRLAVDGASEDDTALHHTLTLVGLNNRKEILELYPHELSIGMAQRVCIAMALLPSPALLIADEPTSAVDASLRRKILDLLLVIQQRRKMSLLLITHDLDAARHYGDRIIVLYNGRIIESAGRKSFTEKPLHPYSRLLAELKAKPRGRAHPPHSPLEPLIVDVPQVGCSFRPRCPIARERCKEVDPELEKIPGEREIRCFYWK
jgi:oligopeptide/dipeptide ABC transporter ATP-binding protein